VFRPQVVQIVCPVSVLTPTDGASELLHSSVRDDVTFQIAFVVKLTLTVGAGKLTLAKMDSQMAL